MGKDSKDSQDHASLQELRRAVNKLRQENEELRARLEKVAELTQDLPEETGETDEDDHPYGPSYEA